MSQICFAQNEIEWPQFKGKDKFSGYLQSMLNADERLIESDCAEFIVAARFTIDTNGHVETVEVSTDERITLKLAIIRAIETTHGQWEPMIVNGKKVISPPMIIPIYFNLESVCEIGQSPTNRMLSNIQRLYNFQPDGSVGQINTVLFAPIYVYGPRGYEDIGGMPKQKSKN